MLEFKLVSPMDEAKRVLDAIDVNVDNNLSLFPTLLELDKKDRKILAGAIA
jgi:hypothetical protein